MNQRTSVLIDLGDLSAPKGSLPWVKAVHLEAMKFLNDANYASERVEVWIGALHDDDHFQVLHDAQDRPFLSWEVFCTTRQPLGLGYSPEAIEAIIAERKALSTRERTQAAAAATTGETLPHGGDRKSRGKKSSDDSSLDNRSAEGESSRDDSYIDKHADRARRNGVSRQTQQRLDRLARDFPELHADVAGGRLSVNAAWIKAGLGQPSTRLPRDIRAAAKLIKTHFQGPRLQELRRLLARTATDGPAASTPVLAFLEAARPILAEAKILTDVHKYKICPESILARLVRLERAIQKLEDELSGTP
jgi:hypothetical protein